MKQTLKDPNPTERVCYHDWKFTGRDRNGNATYICSRCGESY